ncbi:hypothetical protein PO909_016155 [Leuciscus waleckii]
MQKNAISVDQAMSTMVVQECYLWLNLADMRETDKYWFLDSPISQVGLFGDTVESFAQQFSAAQKQTEVIRHILPRRTTAASTCPPLLLPSVRPVSPDHDRLEGNISVTYDGLDDGEIRSHRLLSDSLCILKSHWIITINGKFMFGNNDDPSAGSYTALDLRTRSSDQYNTLTTVHPRPAVHQSGSSEYENVLTAQQDATVK